MIPREAVAAAFRFEETGVVPFYIPMCDDVAARLDAHYGSTCWRDRLVPYLSCRHIGCPLVPLPDGTIRDAFGTILRYENICHIKKPALPSPSLDGYTWPEAEDLEDWDALAAHCRSQEQSFRIYGLGYGLFERSWNMRGFASFLMDMLDAPAFVDDLLDEILRIHKQVMEIIVSRVPVEAYFGGDDLCDQRGPMMGIDLWRRFFKPRYAQLIAHCHSLGLPYVMHSCGNVAPLVDDLLEIGLDALESLQPEAMDIYALKQKTAGRLVLIGGMGSQSTLPYGSPDQVRTETKRLISQMGYGGGYILAPAKPLMPDTPTDNAVAFIETALEFC